MVALPSNATHMRPMHIYHKRVET